MSAAAKAGAAYFAIAFTAGFGLGLLRTLLVAPWLGELAAVLLELPLMLAISWLACGWMLRRFRVDAAASARLGMGGTAFALLMAAEFLLSALLVGGSAADYLAGYATGAGALGLAAQVMFALFPLVRSGA